MRENITIACTECKQRNYETSKNKRNTTEQPGLQTPMPEKEKSQCLMMR